MIVGGTLRWRQQRRQRRFPSRPWIQRRRLEGADIQTQTARNRRADLFGIQLFSLDLAALQDIRGQNLQDGFLARLGLPQRALGLRLLGLYPSVFVEQAPIPTFARASDAMACPLAAWAGRGSSTHVKTAKKARMASGAVITRGLSCAWPWPRRA